MADEAKWYVIHTYSGYENKVATTIEKTVENRKLHDMILEVMIPTEMVTEIKDNKREEIERKIFPGYVLIKMVMNDTSWHVVRNVRGVTSFVGPGSKPVPLTDAEVARFGVEREEIALKYKVGDRVHITDGPLEGFYGIVEEIEPDKDKVRVSVSMLFGGTIVELELGQVDVDQ